MATAAPPNGKPEPTPLDVVKDYLRVTDNVEDDKIQAMIPRARLWVEEHTGIALVQREFTELVLPRGGVVRLSREPLIAVSAAGYTDSSGNPQDFVPVATPPSTKLVGAWPPTSDGTPFAITYMAGLLVVPPEGEEPDYTVIDPRLIGAMLTLIDGEYTAGFAYPPDTVTAAQNCLFYMKFVAP